MQVSGAIIRTLPVIRLAAAVEQIAPGWQASEAKLLIALSGGADSLALTYMAQAAWPGRVHAMTVDHQLRPEAADEAALCAELCAEISVPHSIAAPPTPIKGNLQSQARRVRYQLLSDEAARIGTGTWIATAHHGDDQLETILMRLARGSGVAGLSGIRPRRGNIIRPLLGFHKTELEQVCRDAGLRWIEDPSNQNAQFDRVRMRSALQSTDLPIGTDALARSAKACRDADDALAFAAHYLATTHIKPYSDGLQINANGLPHELKRRLLINAATQLGEENMRGETLERAIESAAQCAKCSIGKLLLTADADSWFLSSAPPRKA